MVIKTSKEISRKVENRLFAYRRTAGRSPGEEAREMTERSENNAPNAPEGKEDGHERG